MMPHATLYTTFKSWCQSNPQAVALIDFHTDYQITYQKLLDKTECIAQRLQSAFNVQPGDRVGILMWNDLSWVTAFFALQALGCVVVPLNTRLSAAELQPILRDCHMQGLIVHSEFKSIVAELQTESSVQSLWTMWQSEDVHTQDALDLEHFLPATIAPDMLAVLIYTSGTTGQAKGVMLSHANLLEDARINALVVKATAQDCFVTASPLFHVFGLTNILLTCLQQGGQLVLIKRFNPKYLLEAITQYRVTFLAAVPTMYQMMLSLLPNPAYCFASLRVCHSGAAPMSVATFKQVETAFGAPVQEGYGQSEASSIMTSNPLEGIRKPASVGLPLEGLEIDIVDEHDQVLPPGEIGELRLNGPTIMMGYWNNLEATQKVLRNGYLYTKDLGYKDEAGYIFLVGRRDDLINVGGSKVYPQLVEDVIYKLPQVAACAVVGEASELYHQVVSAYVVLQPSQALTLQDVQRHCRQYLAEYKVPKWVYFVTDLPKGATGKLLRHQLKPGYAE